jgi:2-keto-4-pentenoate hydratase/2-oxohepta-3-ene-1,7-dioic acid hydratase in catechol pathway
MKFARIGDPGHEVPVLVTGERFLDLRSLTTDLDGAFFAGDGVAKVQRAVRDGALPELTVVEDHRFGAPIARPQAVIGIGMNYAAHAVESGAAPPTQPVVFLKLPNTVVGPNDIASIPRTSVKTDWEVELGVVIGRRVSYLDSPVESTDHIAGFVAVNDLSERSFQLNVSGGQWSKGKCATGFTPVGPWLVTPDEVNHGHLRLRSWVNGEIRQDSMTADMIFDVEYIIWHLSQFMVLEPGDLILTGTPQGVALSERFEYLKAGDVCEIEVEGLGHQRQVFIQA